MKPFVIRAIIAGLCALSLSGCIDSEGPILPDSQPVFGPQLKLQLYSLRDGVAHDPEPATYTWNGALYAKAGGGTHDVAAISIHPFESGDYIVQSVPADKAQKSEYAVLHKLAGGVYLAVAVDEADADEATRAQYCKHPGGAGCRIETREQLFAFARATAAKQKDEGGLVVRLADDPPKPKRPAKRRQQ